MAWRTVIRARPKRSARSRSEGSADPGGQALTMWARRISLSWT